jgi:hypothetical protein
VETTESGNTALSLDSAADMLIQDQQPEQAEEVTEAEEEQLLEDSSDDADDSDDAEVEEVDADEVEEIDDEAEDEEYEDTEEDAEETDPVGDVHTVKVDGEEKQVTLEELKRGYSGQQYVQKGMQEAAEARKQAESVYQALTQERQNLAQLVQNLQAGQLSPPQEPSREMFDSDPIGYMEAKMQYEDQVKEYSVKASQIQEQLQAQSEAEQRARAVYAQQEAQKLVEIIPELRDAGKATQFKEKIVKAATEFYGYTPEEIAAIGSHRDFMVLRDAMLYREMAANKDVVKQKAKKARPSIKPGAKRVRTSNDVDRKQRSQLKKTGSINDALSLILDN